MAGCAGPQPQASSGTVDPHKIGMPVPPVRFLLSFDDGPAAASGSPTASDPERSRAITPLQPGIKAIFFLANSRRRCRRSAPGRQLMRREFEAGHLLAFHTATARTCEPSLSRSCGIRAVVEKTASAISKPLPGPRRRWCAHRSGITTRAHLWHIEAHGLHILLTDLSANDGKTWGINFSPRRRSSLLHQLKRRARTHCGAAHCR